MKLLLGSNESFIFFLIKRNVSKNGSCNKGTNLFDLNRWLFTDGSTIMDVVAGERVTVGVLICSR